MLIVIVNYGHGSKVLKLATQAGAPGGTVLLGMGTTKNRLLEFLELSDVRREVVIIAAESSKAEEIAELVNKEFDLRKPHHGIAFILPLTAFQCAFPTGEAGGESLDSNGGDIMYHSIMAVVELGKAEEVMEAATAAGARGGTVIKARGAGEYSAGKLFHMDIEPEKEIVLILSKAEDTDKIAGAVQEKLALDKPGNGIIFCQDVIKAYGVS
ncbi:MAG: P-II family nitrogen regulator [Oscillospiraceae bacterium]|jgi:nitrogen regulatory protein PII|nr:P-II family nitrogen regulator [Oscillospiraceae bacterium]